MNIVTCLVFVMIKFGMFFVMDSVALCLESGLIYCDCNNVLNGFGSFGHGLFDHGSFGCRLFG
jgi:hypothetical protein